MNPVEYLTGMDAHRKISCGTNLELLGTGFLFKIIQSKQVLLVDIMICICCNVLFLIYI